MKQRESYLECLQSSGGKRSYIYLDAEPAESSQTFEEEEEEEGINGYESGSREN